MDNNIREKLEQWVLKNYDKYAAEYTWERSAGNDYDCFEDGFESGTSWAAYSIGCILGMELEKPDDMEEE